MTVSSLGASTNAYSYLQSLLPQQPDDSKRTGSSDPVTELLQAFYPNSSTEAGAGPPDASVGSGTGTLSPFNHDTMMALMSAQEQPSSGNPFVTARAQSLFSQLDANGDGQVSHSEFENIFGSNADTSKVDGLFNALDGNGDGSVSLDELTSAAQASHAHHHGHRHHGRETPCVRKPTISRTSVEPRCKVSAILACHRARRASSGDRDAYVRRRARMQL